uniref:Uncharacterized protein n=1 Tax=Arundo donax TaxID=35708 RepID=A0A0A9FH08_ARUDO
MLCAHIKVNPDMKCDLHRQVASRKNSHAVHTMRAGYLTDRLQIDGDPVQ